MKILVIQNKMIGDVLASTIICNNLKVIYPKASVHYLIYPFTKPVVEQNPNIDKIILFEEDFKSNKIKFVSFLFKIRKQKYDIVIDAYSKLESKLIVTFSNAKTKIGYQKTSLNFVYNKKVEDISIATRNAGNALENRLNLLSPLANTETLSLRPKLFLTQNELEVAKQKMKNLGIDLTSKIYMISILGSEKLKSYPNHYMAKVLDCIVEQTNASLLFNYIPKQKEEVLEIYNLCKPSTQNNIKIDFVSLTIREFLAVTNFCNAVIGNEGGAINMAKALDKPTFTIFSTWINKQSWNSFEDGKTTISVHLKDLKPELYGEKSAKEMKIDALKLYQEFEPELFLDKLKRFLTKN